MPGLVATGVKHNDRQAVGVPVSSSWAVGPAELVVRSLLVEVEGAGKVHHTRSDVKENEDWDCRRYTGVVLDEVVGEWVTLMARGLLGCGTYHPGSKPTTNKDPEHLRGYGSILVSRRQVWIVPEGYHMCFAAVVLRDARPVGKLDMPAAAVAAGEDWRCVEVLIVYPLLSATVDLVEGNAVLEVDFLEEVPRLLGDKMVQDPGFAVGN